MHREMASLEGGDPFLSDAVGTTGKADILNSSILPIRTRTASTAPNAPFPPGNCVKYDEPSTLKGS